MSGIADLKQQMVDKQKAEAAKKFREEAQAEEAENKEEDGDQEE
jgi:hypothetical protein